LTTPDGHLSIASKPGDQPGLAEARPRAYPLAWLAISSLHEGPADGRRLTHEDLFDIIVRRRLHFDQSRQTGVVFHIVSALSERGLVGLTAVGDSPEQADASYREAEGVLLAEAKSALEPATLAAP
jgi:hypothetical protein